ncbi:hypothetical protein FB451DRAFT_1301995 [Mycena latifolia]|nr:hypothetical protein FB451DRAFT_1301995 [Mycena latifolia]
MYPRLTEALDRVQLTATRDKENVAPEHERECKPAPTPKPPTFRCTLVADNTAIIGDTLNFEGTHTFPFCATTRNADDCTAALSVHELNGTALGPAALLAGLRAAEQGNDAVYYHLWVAARAAVEEQRRTDIHTNLTLVAGLMHAAVCAEARATVISIAVGPLLQSHERRRRAVYRDLALHPGVEVVQAVFAYFRLHEIRTRVVGRDFREASHHTPAT